MPGPRTTQEAKKWAYDAICQAMYVPSVHFKQRCAERKVTMVDAHHIVYYCKRVEAYSDGVARNDGTLWRLWGRCPDGDREVGVGIEAFRDASGKRWITLCTVIVRED